MHLLGRNAVKVKHSAGIVRGEVPGAVVIEEICDVADLESVAGDYDGVRVYARTKRMQVVLAEAWATRLAGTDIRVESMHPGWVDPGAQRPTTFGWQRDEDPAAVGLFLGQVTAMTDTDNVWSGSELS